MLGRTASPRYGFLVYNATLVFWTVVRPLCRPGWQAILTERFERYYGLMKQVRRAGVMQRFADCGADVIHRGDH